MADSGKVVLGLLAGIAIGATLGILFAPDKGTETRRKLAEKAEGMEEDLEKQFNEFMNEMKKKLATVKEQVEEGIAEEQKKTAQGKEITVPAP